MSSAPTGTGAGTGAAVGNGAGAEGKPDIVVFSKDDPEDSKNWTRGKKRLVVVQVCLLAFAAVFGSSFYAATEVQIQQKYGASQVTASSGLTVYVLGFSFGPLFWPMSEMYGRRLPYLLSWPLLFGMTAPSAFVNNLAVIIVFRFLAGCCAACALNNGGGILSDMYNIVDMQAQAIAISWYAAAIFAGPCVALPIGFFIAADAGPELWVLRVYFFFAIALLPVVFLLPETHGPTVLAARSKRLRKKGGRPNARAAHELKHESKRQLLAKHIGRPAAMFLREPIIQGAAIWTSLAYGIVYLFFEVYPVVFFTQHHFSFQLTGLPFLAMVIGFFFAALFYVPLVKYFMRMPVPSFIQPVGSAPDSPESRLKLALFACLLMPVSLFWFAWTSGGETHWIAPTLAGIPFGFATITIFYTFLTYSSQTFTIYASSASACNTFFRSLAGSIFPVASHQIVRSLGTKWGVSLFGFLSLGLIPIPLIFLRYGAIMRSKSHYAQEANAIVAKMRAAAAAAKQQAAQAAAMQQKQHKVAASIASHPQDVKKLEDDEDEGLVKPKLFDAESQEHVVPSVQDPDSPTSQIGLMKMDSKTELREAER